MADPTGFEPAISSVTGWHVGPLHHGSVRRMGTIAGAGRVVVRPCSSTQARPRSPHALGLNARDWSGRTRGSLDRGPMPLKRPPSVRMRGIEPLAASNVPTAFE